MFRVRSVASLLLLLTLFCGAAGVFAQSVPSSKALEGPSGTAKPVTPSAERARPATQGTVALEIPANRDLTSTGLFVRRGDVVKIRAWGRVRIAKAGNTSVYPEGFNIVDPLKLLPDATTCALLAVVGDDNADYVVVGREVEFKAKHDGMLFLALNQSDVAGNLGEFEARVTVGEKRGLEFGLGGELLARPAGVAGSASQTTPPLTSNPSEKEIVVSARRDWTNTAIELHKGDTVSIEARGTVVLDLGGTAATPDGSGVLDANKLIPEKPTGALVAVVGIDNNDFIFVGSKGTIVAARDGLLFLGVNEDDLSNNSGAFTAIVHVTPAKPPQKSSP